MEEGRRIERRPVGPQGFKPCLSPLTVPS